MLEALLEFIEQEVKRGEAYEAQCSSREEDAVGGYVSVIKVAGEPILPPVVSTKQGVVSMIVNP